MDVKLIFRKKVPEYYSMENVFTIILQSLRKRISATIIHAGSNKATPAAILKNILSFRKARADVFHVTGDIHYAVFAFPAHKVMLTIHDCVFLQNTNGIKKFVMLWFWHKLPVRYARIITTISEATKKDIIRITGCDESKIRVIGNPADPAYIYYPGSFNQQKPVILQIGTWPNKNLERVIKALDRINCHLSIIGKLTEEQKRLLTLSGIEFSNHIFLSKEELIRQYIECDLVLFVSTFEGFGLPVIEAQSIGRPLITSNISPLNEVAYRGAHLVDPFDVNAIREGVKKVISDVKYREQLIKEGMENVERYQPAHIASQYLELYEKISEGS